VEGLEASEEIKGGGIQSPRMSHCVALFYQHGVLSTGGRMILVTGATGHVGNVLVRMLLEQGEPVRALVRSGRNSDALEGLNVVITKGDILDAASLRSAMQGVEVVYHLAAKISIDPGSDQEVERVNIVGTRNVLREARAAGVRRLVYVSSVYALRAPVEGVMDETCPFDLSSARGVYDRSKAAASLEALKAATSGQEVVIASPTAVVGPFDFQTSEAGRGILLNIPQGIKFYIDGGYDFVDVRDVAKGLILAADKGRSGQNYILGGERLTIKEVSEIVWEAAGGWHVGIRLPGWVADLAAMFLPLFTDSPLVTDYSLNAVRSNSNINHKKAEQELGYHPRSARKAVLDAVHWWLTRRSGVPIPEMIESVVGMDL
jgi:dihydroflavonol-4-reductase